MKPIAPSTIFLSRFAIYSFSLTPFLFSSAFLIFLAELSIIFLNGHSIAIHEDFSLYSLMIDL